jgi:hypothetical protein
MAFVQGDAVLPAVQGSPGTRRMLSESVRSDRWRPGTEGRG